MTKLKPAAGVRIKITKTFYQSPDISVGAYITHRIEETRRPILKGHNMHITGVLIPIKNIHYKLCHMTVKVCK